MDLLKKAADRTDLSGFFFGLTGLLLRQTKYRYLKNEIEERCEEIKQGEALTHRQIWDRQYGRISRGDVIDG